MKIDKRIWIQIIGLYFAVREPLVLLDRDFIKYQSTCLTLVALILISTALKIILC